MEEINDITKISNDEILKRFEERISKKEADEKESGGEPDPEVQKKLAALQASIKKIRRNMEHRKNRERKIKNRKRVRRLMADKSRKRNRL